MEYRYRVRVLVTMLGVAGAVFIAPMAQACQLVCMYTMATYTGNLGGWSGADAKCAAEYPNFKFARNASIVASVASSFNLANSGYGNAISNAWAGGVAGAWSDGDGNAHPTTNSCANWTTNASGAGGQPYNDPGTGAPYYGTIAGFYSGTYDHSTSVQVTPCTGSYPLLCCNM